MSCLTEPNSIVVLACWAGSLRASMAPWLQSMCAWWDMVAPVGGFWLSVIVGVVLVGSLSAWSRSQAVGVPSITILALHGIYWVGLFLLLTVTIGPCMIRNDPAHRLRAAYDVWSQFKQSVADWCQTHDWLIELGVVVVVALCIGWIVGLIPLP